jgi:hypothetical protein
MRFLCLPRTPMAVGMIRNTTKTKASKTLCIEGASVNYMLIAHFIHPDA